MTEKKDFLEEARRMVFEHAPDACYLSDLRGVFLDGNRAAEKLVGYKREELIGSSFLKLRLLPARQIPKAARLLLHNRRGLPTGPDAFILRRKDGKEIEVEISTHPVHVEGKTVVLGIARDVTQRSQMEDALRMSEEKYRVLLNHLPVGIYRTTPEGKVIEANQTMAEILGFSRISDLLRANTCDFYRQKSDRVEYVQLLEKTDRYYREVQLRRSDGQILWCRDYARAIRNKSGRVLYYDGILVDVTEHKQVEIALGESEERYRAIFESFRDVYYRTDLEGRITVISPSILANAGYDPAEVVGRPVTDFYINPDDRLVFDRKLRESGALDDYELKLKAKNGSVIETSASSSMIWDADGNPLGAQGVLRDITARKKAEEDLRSARDVAQSASRAKSEFLASMSHELRTPLNAIIGFSEVLFEQFYGPLNERQKEYLTDILHSARHLMDMINDILDYSEIEAGGIEPEYSSVKVGDFVRNSLNMVKEQCARKAIDLTCRVDPRAERLEVRGDERRLKQLMYNLLSNAVKFTPEEGRIEVRADPDEAGLHITVADSGLGIGPEHQEKIFEAFYQASGGTRNKTPGTGLGLNICKQIVDIHRGKIWVESEGERKGSQFHFVLPLGPTDGHGIPEVDQ